MKYFGIDFHGSADFEGNFSEVDPKGIDLYFYNSNNTGKGSCMRQCSHCSLKTLRPYHIPLKLAGEIAEDLARKGYNIAIFPTDSFSDEVLLEPRIPRLATNSWTSGTPLLCQSWKKRLSRGFTIFRYRSITLCGYGMDGLLAPFKGVIKAKSIETVVDRINIWNQENPPGYQVNFTFTIWNGNRDMDSLRKMADACLQHGVTKARFNCFVNFRTILEHYRHELSYQQIIEFYGNLARVFLEYRHSALRFEVSENFGNAGIEQIKLPPTLSVEFKPTRTTSS